MNYFLCERITYYEASKERNLFYIKCVAKQGLSGLQSIKMEVSNLIWGDLAYKFDFVKNKTF